MWTQPRSDFPAPMSKHKPIPMHGGISFEDWKAGIPARRRISEEAAPGPARRSEGGAEDRRLRAAFKGKRAPSKEDLAPPAKSA